MTDAQEARGWESASAPRRRMWPALVVALVMVAATAVAFDRAGTPETGLLVEEDEGVSRPEPAPQPEPALPSEPERRPRGAAPAPDWAAGDDVTGTWASLPPADIAGRADPVVAWTGDPRRGRSTAAGSAASPHQAAYEPFVRGLVLVWGGYGADGALADGAAYDPTTGLWRRMPAAPHPWTWGSTEAAAWTGDELLVVTLAAEASAAAVVAYDPQADRWRETAPPPPEVASWHSAAWTGRELVVLAAGGDHAAAYHPGDDAWRARPAPPVDSDRGALRLAPVAEGLAAFGMHEDRPAVSLLPTGGAAWSEPANLPGDGRPSVPTPATAATAGADDRLVVLGSIRDRSGYQQAWAWSPARGWERLPNLQPAPSRLARFAPTERGHLAWIGEGASAGAVLEPGARSWAPMANPPIAPRREAGAAWTGQSFVVWGGVGPGGFRDDGALYLP